MARVNTKIGGGGPSDVVSTGTYLVKVKQTSLVTSKKGTMAAKVDVGLREDGEAKHISFYIYFLRPEGHPKGRRIRRGCDTIQAFGKAVGIDDPTDYDLDDLAGKVLALELDVEDGGGQHPDKNVIDEVFAAVKTGDGKWAIGKEGLMPQSGPLDDDVPPADDPDSDIPF